MLPCPPVGAGECQEQWHSHVPILKSVHMHRNTHSPATLSKPTGVYGQDIFPAILLKLVSMSSLTHSPAACKNQQIHVIHTGIPHDHLALWLRELVFQRPQDYTNQKESFWQATIPRALNTQQTKYNSSLYMKKNPVYLAWIFTLRDRLQVSNRARG